MGTLGLGDGINGAAGLTLGYGSRIDGKGQMASGGQISAHVAGGRYFKASSLGNLAGLEGGMSMGYDGVPIADNVGLAGNMGYALNLWIGFPVTLVNLGDGKQDWLRLNFAPGMGTSLLGAYLYLKSTLAVALPGVGPSELTYTWWPNAVTTQGTGAGGALNTAAVRATLYPKLGDRRWQVFAQYHKGQLVKSAPAAGDPLTYNGLTGPPGQPSAFSVEKRTAWDSLLTLGVGACF